MPPRKLLLGISTISGASLMLELCLTRIFSVTLFYHFAFLVVSMALFGLGAAGIWVYLRQRAYPPEKLARALSFHALAFAVCAVLCLGVVLATRVPAEFGAEALPSLGLLFAATSLPFFFSGMALSLAITVLREQVSRVYAFDLLGAAAGCLLVLPTLDWIGAPGAVLTAAALAASSALLFCPATRRRLLVCSAWAAAFWGLLAVDAGWSLFRVPSVKATDEQRVIWSAWNSFSRVTVSSAPEPILWIHIDSDAATAIFKGPGIEQAAAQANRFVEARMAALVYSIRRAGHALIIGPGGGADVVGALSRGVARVTGVELNPLIAEDVMQQRFAEFSGGLYLRSEVELVVGEGRSFVRGSGKRYASIQATLVDTWAATSAGAFTLSENNLYTREAFRDFLDHLEPGGVLTMTRWMRTPPREFVRLISLGTAALDDRGVTDRTRHFFVAGDGRAATFLLNGSPFSAAELDTLRQTCRQDGLRVIYDPDRPGQDLLARIITSPDPRAIWESHPLDISPPSDDRPFFFYTTRPDQFVASLFAPLSEGETGVRVLASLLLVVGLAVLGFLLLPLLWFSRADLTGRAGRKLAGLVYFASIGIGFIGLEMAWMQHFILFLGHPIYALGLVLFVLLLASGLGSRLTVRVPPERALRALWPSVGLLALLVGAYGFGLGPLFGALVGLELYWRIAIAAGLLCLPGLLMGRMLPLGIRVLSQTDPGVVPWAWGVNGAASVFGSVLAVALAMNLGYASTQIFAGGIYLLGTAALWLAYRRAGLTASA